MNLYDLTSNWQHVYDMDLDEDTWLDTLNSIDEEIDIKANNIGFLIQNLTADVEGYKREEKRLADKRRVAENKIKSLKSYLQDNMERLDRKKIKTDLFSFNIQRNAPSLQLTDEQLIPQKYYTVESVRKYDKQAIKDDLKAGQVILTGQSLERLNRSVFADCEVLNGTRLCTGIHGSQLLYTRDRKKANGL